MSLQQSVRARAFALSPSFAKAKKSDSVDEVSAGSVDDWSALEGALVDDDGAFLIDDDGAFLLGT